MLNWATVFEQSLKNLIRKCLKLPKLVRMLCKNKNFIIFSLTGNPEYFRDNYVAPWCRFSPYVFGILLGFALHLTKKKPFKMPRVKKSNFFIYANPVNFVFIWVPITWIRW